MLRLTVEQTRCHQRVGTGLRVGRLVEVTRAAALLPAGRRIDARRFGAVDDPAGRPAPPDATVAAEQRGTQSGAVVAVGDQRLAVAVLQQPVELGRGAE